jgi:hypothetical protein
MRGKGKARNFAERQVGWRESRRVTKSHRQQLGRRQLGFRPCLTRHDRQLLSVPTVRL